MYNLWKALESAKNLKWVELSHQLDNSSPYWSGIVVFRCQVPSVQSQR